MKDRVPGSPGRYTAVITADAFKLLQDGKSFPITLVRDDDPIDEGTPYSKAAVLPDSVAAKICPDIEDPTPADAFASLLPLIGGTMTGSIAMGGKGIKGLGSPTEDGDAVNLGYANDKFRPSTWTPTASDVGAVPTSRTVNGKELSSNITLSASDISGVGTNQVFSKLTDIGITTFPTTMSTVASKMPNNSTLIIDSRDIVSSGVNEISDLGATGAGTYMIMRGNTTSRVQLLHIYGAATATTSFVEVGNYAVTPNTVTWVRALDNSDSNYGTASASNSYHTAYFAKIGKLVICTLLPKAKNTQALYSETITIPSGYRPSSGMTFSIFSDTAVNAGDSTGKATVSASTGGVLTVASTYGISVAEASKTYCWVTA